MRACRYQRRCFQIAARTSKLKPRVAAPIVAALLLAFLAGALSLPALAQEGDSGGALIMGSTQLQAASGETVYDDDSKHDLDDPNTTYVIKGDGALHTDGNYFTVPKGKSDASNPIVIILDNVNRTQKDRSPDGSFIKIESDNYVIVKLRGNNFIEAGEDKQHDGSNDGMAAIHVSSGSTVKVTSEDGDGSTNGSLEARGGGSKYGGAAIGTRYNDDTGTIIIAGGTIKATGAHCASGIGSGRDGAAKDIQITGGHITAQGGDYAAGIGAGDNVATGKGGDLYNLTITGGTVNATGGKSGAGIGGSEGGWLRGQLLVSGGNVTAQGGDQASGIGCGEGGGLSTDDGEKGSISITGGTIKATGGSDGAGIGGGDHSGNLAVTIDQASGATLSIDAQGGRYGAGIGMGDGEGQLVDITLRGGAITARGGEHGAGIGAGDSANTITIKGTGTINAYGGSSAAAIGAGYDHEVNKSITIEGDTDGTSRGLTILADSGGGLAAGIGSGSEDCAPISIKNATVTAYGDGGAADIGTGGNMGNGGTISSITIENCRIDTKGTSKSGAGIGAGEGCECKKISITKSECYGNSIGEGMGVFFVIWSNLGDMDSITIEDSTIEANWDRASGASDLKGSSAAGIGSNTLGCIRTLTITRSNVKAKGINGGAGIGSGGWGADNYLGTEYVGGEAGDITITDSAVEATGAEPGTTSNTTTGPDLSKRPIIGGGAGIGGGGNTNCQTLTITNSTVTANAGKYAAGLGGGGSESVDSVTISNSNVTATGGDYGAGIGSGGSTNATTETIFHADVDTIDISGSTVTAKGGKNAAGIGTGCGAAMDSTDVDDNAIENNVKISDSTVSATGGEGGAGIGGGTVGAYSRGGHSGNILLSGTSHITATGGRQGAGVGGGAASEFQNHGGCDSVVVDLTSCAKTPQGPDAIGADGGWLVATGGQGAAGIGAGGYLFHDKSSDPTPNTNDTQYVEIKGGYVKATGGADDTDGAGENTGSGAGIGGGAAGTRLKSLEISGGWVEAARGGEHAFGIGPGGESDSSSDGDDDANNRYHVAGGTVVTDAFGPNGAKVFDGGSIGAASPVSDATNSDGTHVYKTTLMMQGSTLERVDASITSYPDYGTSDLFADGGSLVYPYLPVSSEDAQTAHVVEHQGSSSSVSGDYYGTTTVDGAGWLKMKGEPLSFDGPQQQHYDDVVTLTLQDSQVAAGATWNAGDVKVSGAAELVEVVSGTSPGMQVKVHITGVGSYHVEAYSASSNAESPLYWGYSASYDCTTLKAPAEVKFAESASKTYDGQPVSNPAACASSGAPITYAYSTVDGSAPKDAGSYEVTATAQETECYAGASAKQSFTIAQAPTAVELQLSANGATGTATATVQGLYESDGSVAFEVNGSQVGGDVQLDGDCQAVLSNHDVPAGDYTVKATYKPGSGNYQGSQAAATGNKDLATRAIAGDRAQSKTYGDASFSLGMAAESGTGTAADAWTYEVVLDSFRNLGFDDAVSVDASGNVTVNHAGRSVVKVTLSDGRSAYNDAAAFVVVTVSRKDLTVSSYVRQKNAADSPVAEATYGSLGNLESALKYTGLLPADAPDFQGKLGVAPLPVTLGATDAYAVPILRSGDGYLNARDYRIAYDYATLKVKKRELIVMARNAAGTYGGEEPVDQYTWDVAANASQPPDGGLAAWDNRETVFSEEPAVTRTGGDYKTLDAGTYGGALAPSGGESPNYDVQYVAGNLVVRPASLRDKSRFAVSVEPAVYDGSSHQQPATVTDGSLGKALEQGEGKDFTVSYAGDDTNAGYAWAIVKGNGNYTGFQVQRYAIQKRPVSVQTQSATKLYDGTPLTAPGSEEGIIDGDATFEVTGSQTEPGNTRNSYMLTFSEGAESNYAISEKLGVLYVQSNDISRYKMSQPEGAVYDGKEHRQPVTITGVEGELAEGVDYTLSYESTAGNLVDAGAVTVTAKGVGKYSGTKTVTYEIAPAPLLVETDSAAKLYDGTPLTAPGCTLFGLVNDESATLAATGSVTDVGSAANTYEIRWDGTAKEGNYEVGHEDLGLLTVLGEETPSPSDDAGAGPAVVKGSSVRSGDGVAPALPIALVLLGAVAAAVEALARTQFEKRS